MPCCWWPAPKAIRWRQGLRCQNSRVMRATTMRNTKPRATCEKQSSRRDGGCAGQPEPAQQPSHEAFLKFDDARELRRKLLCRLTLELSGGAAVRLNEMLDGCDEVCLGEAVGPDERRTTSNRPPQTTSSES